MTEPNPIRPGDDLTTDELVGALQRRCHVCLTCVVERSDPSKVMQSLWSGPWVACLGAATQLQHHLADPHGEACLVIDGAWTPDGSDDDDFDGLGEYPVGPQSED